MQALESMVRSIELLDDVVDVWADPKTKGVYVFSDRLGIQIHVADRSRHRKHYLRSVGVPGTRR